MEVKKIQTLLNVWPFHTKETVYKTLLDPKSKKEYTEVTVYNIYDHKGQIKTNDNTKNKVDVVA